MEATGQLNIEIITPAGIAFSGAVFSCQAPGKSGKFQILPGHTSLLSALDIGVLNLETLSEGKKHIAISGGFFEISNNIITVLTDAAEISDKINADRAEKAKSRALARLQKSPQDVDIKRAEAALARALNRLKTIKYLK